MVVDDLMLRAFVDGELDPLAREAVESSIARSPPLQAQVAALRASCLPYRAAFEQQALPPLPERLQQRVAACVEQAQEGEMLAGTVPGTSSGGLMASRIFVMLRRPPNLLSLPLQRPLPTNSWCRSCPPLECL